MSAIAGYFLTKPISSDEHLFFLYQMSDQLRHRGEQQGHWIDRSQSLALLYRQRSTNQEKQISSFFVDELKTVVVIVDGELYDTPLIKKKLELLDHALSEHPAELIAHAYKQWGMSFLHHVDGSFVAAIYDIAAHKLFLIRDQIGEMPLFVYHNDHSVSFSSEMKALWCLPWVQRHTNMSAVSHYFFYQTVRAPYTLYENMYKLPPGFSVAYDDNLNVITKKWAPSTHTSQFLPVSAHRYEQLDALLKSAVYKRMSIQKPLGILVSRGIDVAILACVIAHFMPHFYVFSPSFDQEELKQESSFAQRIAYYFGANYFECLITERDAFNFFPYISYYLDEPCGDSRTIPYFIGLNALRDAGIKTVFTGDGLNEFFSIPAIMHRWQLTFSWLSPFLIQKTPLIFRTIMAKIGLHFLYPSDHRAILLRRWAENSYSVARTNNIFDQVMRDNLVKKNELFFDARWQDAPIELVDRFFEHAYRASLATNVSMRFPLLDRQLLSYLHAMLPQRMGSADLEKNTMYRFLAHLLPREIVCRPHLHFATPVSTWFFKGTYFGNALKELLHDRTRGWHELLDFDEIKRMLILHQEGKIQCGEQLWSLYALLATEKVW